MTKRSLSPELLEIIKEQRQNPTPAEDKLWQELRGSQLMGCKFRRQHPVAGYILDFFCAELKIGIEVDGEAHRSPEQKLHDRQRSDDLAKYGVRIIRFWNSEVTGDIESTLRKITDFVEQVKREKGK